MSLVCSYPSIYNNAKVKPRCFTVRVNKYTWKIELVMSLYSLFHFITVFPIWVFVFFSPFPDCSITNKWTKCKWWSMWSIRPNIKYIDIHFRSDISSLFRCSKWWSLSVVTRTLITVNIVQVLWKFIIIKFRL